MSLTAVMFRKMAGAADAKRDAGLMTPEDIQRADNLCYMGDNNINHLLDVYNPKGTTTPLPVIVSIHGGGYVYGDKDLYQYYCMSLAQHGFTVVNFSYTLAPAAKFPTQLTEINEVFTWMTRHAEEYHMDLSNVFVVGDSAGAQLASQYAAIFTNPEYAKLFSFTVPTDIQMRGLGLNCGMYDMIPGVYGEGGEKVNKLYVDYMGKDREQFRPMLKVLDYITSAYPPAFVMTSQYDFLKENAKPMCDFLTEKGVEAEYHLYGEEGQKYMAHVFHCNIRLDEAKQCNTDECEFFQKHVVQ